MAVVSMASVQVGSDSQSRCRLGELGPNWVKVTQVGGQGITLALGGGLGACSKHRLCLVYDFQQQALFRFVVWSI